MPITKLNKDYEILKDKESFIFMLRHAEKQVYPNNSGENSISITEKGRIDSENFGREFARIYYVISLIKSSPIKRCVNTANAILKGANQQLKISISTNLGNPRAFVIDEKIAGENFFRYGVEKVIQRQLEGKNLPGMRDIKNGAKLLLTEILEDLENLNGSGLYITHDAILVPFIGYLTNTFIVSDYWFGFLDGIYLWKENKNKVFLLWKGKVFDITNKVRELI